MTVTLLLDMWLLIISHTSVKFDSHRSSENEFITHYIRTHHSVKFLSHSSCRSRNITFFIRHLITWSRAKSVKRLDGWCSLTINLYLFKVWQSQPSGKWRYIFFFWPRDFMWPGDHTIMELSWLWSLSLTQQCAKCGSHTSCASGNVIYSHL